MCLIRHPLLPLSSRGAIRKGRQVKEGKKEGKDRGEAKEAKGEEEGARRKNKERGKQEGRGRRRGNKEEVGRRLRRTFRAIVVP